MKKYEERFIRIFFEKLLKFVRKVIGIYIKGTSAYVSYFILFFWIFMSLNTLYHKILLQTEHVPKVFMRIETKKDLWDH